MAYAHSSQRSLVIPRPHFFDHRTVISSLGSFPRSFVIGNPNFRPATPCVEFLVPVNPPFVPSVGFTVNPALLIHMDEERSRSLLQFMADEGLLPSPDDELKRLDAIAELKQIVLAWIKKVAWQRRLPKSQILSTSSTILTYGSYGLGVHGPESDIDALCVGPSFATMTEDFFIVLRNMLQNRHEVSEIHCVKDAKVPLMRFKFNGISIDLPYAQLKVPSVPDNVDILNPLFLRNIDETSWKSLSGVRANICILQLVPNLQNFQSMLRCLKLWARRRGVYGNLLGFFGGIHLAILSAYVCQRHPNASLNTLISKFFETFALWRWPTPVVLQDGMMPLVGDVSETHFLMPIRLPCSPFEFCHSNITRSTFHRIVAEFLRGHAITKDLLRPNFAWSSLFEHFCYTKRYMRFVRIFLSASNLDALGDWVGWVKSRIRCLLVKLEEVHGFCDPNPIEYVDIDATEPNIVFYWGLKPGRNIFIDLDFVEQDFVKNINNGCQGPRGRIALSIVQAKKVSNVEFDLESGKDFKAYWRIFRYNEQRKSIYSQHLPQYFIGYVATYGDVSAVGG